MSWSLILSIIFALIFTALVFGMFAAWTYESGEDRKRRVLDMKLRAATLMEQWEAQRKAGNVSDAQWERCQKTYKEAMEVEE